MSTELWENHNAPDIEIKGASPFGWEIRQAAEQEQIRELERQREEQFRAEMEQREKQIIEEFMKDPYKFFDGAHGPIIELYFD